MSDSYLLGFLTRHALHSQRSVVRMVSRRFLIQSRLSLGLCYARRLAFSGTLTR